MARLQLCQAMKANQARPRKPPPTTHKPKHSDEKAKKVQATIKVSDSQIPTITNLANELDRLKQQLRTSDAVRDMYKREAKELQHTIKISDSQIPTINNLTNERDRLKQLLCSSNDVLDLYKRELNKTSATVQDKDDMIATIKEDKLALERRVEEHAELEEDMMSKLQFAEFRADLLEGLDKKGDDKLICKLREDVNAQWLRATNAEEHVRRLEHDLTHANSQLQQGCNARNEIQTLQQKLDTSVANAQKADYEIQELRKALEASNNHATDIYQQAVAHIQSLGESASQEVQRLIELGNQVEARANEAELANRGLQQTNAEQATAIRTLQYEAQKWKDLSEDRTEKASVAAREVEQKTQQLEERTGRANDAEAKVEGLKQKIFKLETAVAQKGEAAREPSPDFEKACVITEQADRFERELEEATELLEELAASGMDKACRDVLENLVYTNQTFKSVEAECEDDNAPSVKGVNSILEDAMANLNHLHLIENADRPVLVRQTMEAHGVRMRIDEIMIDAELSDLTYLEKEEKEKIKKILKSPRTLSGLEATASSSLSSPLASHPNTSTAAPLYNPPRPQQAPSTAPSQLPGLHLPGLQLTNPTASPTTGAPPPFNPLFNSTQPANPSTPALPYRLSPAASASTSLIPLLNLPQDSFSSDSSSDSDDELPEAFEGQYDEESDSDDAMVPPVGERPKRQPVSRRRRSQHPEAAVFM